MFYLLIPASIFGADSYIKQKIENEGKEGEAREILGGKFLLRKVHNKGAVRSWWLDSHLGLRVVGFWDFYTALG